MGVANLLCAAGLVSLQSQLLLNLNPLASTPFSSFGLLPVLLPRLLTLVLTFFQATLLAGSPTAYSFLVSIAYAAVWLLGYAQPPSSNYSFNFQSSLFSVFASYFSLSVFLTQAMDSGKPDNLSLLYLLASFCLIAFIHYFMEKHKLAAFLNPRLLRLGADCQWLPSLYSLVVLLERADAPAHRRRVNVYLKSLECAAATAPPADKPLTLLLHKILLSSRPP